MGPILSTEIVGNSLAYGFYLLFEICWPLLAPIIGACIVGKIVKFFIKSIFATNYVHNGYSPRQVKRKLSKVDAGIDLVSNGIDIHNSVYKK